MIDDTITMIKHRHIKFLWLILATVMGAGIGEAKIGDPLHITTSKAAIYAAPSVASAQLLTLKPETTVTEMERRKGWVLVVERQSGVHGWVKSAVVRHGKRATRMRMHAALVDPVTAQESLRSLGPVRSLTLKEMGLKKGFTFKHAQSAYLHDFYFQTPLDSRIRGGVFRLNYRASKMLLPISNVSIYVNDVPLAQTRLVADNMRHEIAIVLPAETFTGDTLKVTIEAGIVIDDSMCLDLRAGGGFLAILPNTALDIAYGTMPRSIRDAWRMLPKHVVISVPAEPLDEQQFSATMSIMELLRAAHKEIEITHLPALGDLVVASKDEIVDALNQRGKLMHTHFTPLKNGDIFRTPTDNISLIRSAGMAAIAITDPYDVQPLYLLDGRWELLAAGRHYDLNQPDQLYTRHSLPDNGTSDHYQLPLYQLNTEPHYIRKQTEWDVILAPHDLPAGTRLETVELNIIAPVRWQDDPTYELYAFLNDVLVFTTRLPNDGRKHHYAIPLPADYQQQYNGLRFVVQHDIKMGLCQGTLPTDFVQITPDTSVVVKRIDKKPTKFALLSQYLSSGFDTFISDQYLSHPDVALQMIAQMLANLSVTMDYSRIHFLPAGSQLSPNQPFVAFGAFNLDNIDAPIRLNQGPIEIRDQDGQSFFSINHLPKVTIAEIASASSVFGLLEILPESAQQRDFRKPLRLVEGDVAFLDGNGVLLSIDSRQPTLAEVYYPDTQDWFAELGQYRFWLLGLLWFLLSLAIVYIFRISRKRNEEEDKDMAMPTAADLQSQRVHHANLNVDDDDKIEPKP